MFNIAIILIYITTVPLALFIEYILDEIDGDKIGDFNVKVITRGYILVLSFLAGTGLKSFSRSFVYIMPFTRFEWQLSTFVLMKVNSMILIKFRQPMTL
jgi:hypothetical protein